MADYFARVELHGAVWPTGYEALHKALAQHGFTNCVPSGDKPWRLPTAFYYSTGRIDDTSAVEDAVRQCANSTGYKNEVIVVKSADWRSHLSTNC